MAATLAQPLASELEVFASKANKAVLWGVLEEGQLLQGFSSTSAAVRFFEDTHAGVLRHALAARSGGGGRSSLELLNQAALRNFMASASSARHPLSPPKAATSQLARAKAEVDKMKRGPMPGRSVRFADDTDEPQPGEMDARLKEIIARREAQASEAATAHEGGAAEAARWLGASANAPRKLQIGDSLSREVASERIETVPAPAQRPSAASHLLSRLKPVAAVSSEELRALEGRIVGRIDAVERGLMALTDALAEVSAHLARLPEPHARALVEACVQTEDFEESMPEEPGQEEAFGQISTARVSLTSGGPEQAEDKGTDQQADGSHHEGLP